MSCEPFRAVLHRDGTSFLMARGAWRSGWTPVTSLPGWIDLYRSLRDRKGTPANKRTGEPAKPGPYHDIHGPCVTALEALQAKIREVAAQ